MWSVLGEAVSRLIVTDYETTGLDPRAGAEPIELAVVVLDDSFRELASAEWLILPSGLEHWDPEALAMHSADRPGLPGGLAGLCRRWGKPRDVVAAELFPWLFLFVEHGPLHLVGNSVHFDRGFLDVYFPSVAKMFHHRHLDVSSIRMLAERVTTARPLQGDKPHRAMADVRRSIAELKYWTRALKDAQIPDSWGAQ